MSEGRKMHTGDDRYTKQMTFWGVGADGQQRLADSSVLVAGVGALGGTLAQLMVRAGVGRVRIVDCDRVALNNLHRQLLFDEDDVSQAAYKAETAGRKLKAMNHQVRVEAIVTEIKSENIADYMADVDLVLDALDNLSTRMLINQASIDLHKPWIYAGVLGSGGNVMLILPGRTPCLRCLFPAIDPEDNLPSMEMVGILGPVPALAASLSANEAIKYLVGATGALAGGMLQFDLWNNTFNLIPLRPPSENCICARHE